MAFPIENLTRKLTALFPVEARGFAVALGRSGEPGPLLRTNDEGDLELALSLHEYEAEERSLVGIKSHFAQIVLARHAHDERVEDYLIAWARALSSIVAHHEAREGTVAPYCPADFTYPEILGDLRVLAARPRTEDDFYALFTSMFSTNRALGVELTRLCADRLDPP